MKVKIFYIRETLSKYETFVYTNGQHAKQCVIRKNYSFQLEKSSSSYIPRNIFQLHWFCNYLLIILILIPFNHDIVKEWHDVRSFYLEYCAYYLTTWAKS